MPASFGVEISLGSKPGAGIRKLHGVESAAADMTPALKRIRKSFYAAERQQFTSQGEGDWRPLTAAYLARKAKRGQDPRIMRASGELYRALALRQGAGAVDQMDAEGFTLGTNLPRAVFAQRGSGRRRRRLIVITKRRAGRWTRYIRDHLLGEDAGGGDG